MESGINTEMRKTTCASSVRQNFTLLELLIVVAIIAILAGLLLPALNRARESASSIACVSNLKQILLALTSYADDHKGVFPVFDGPATMSDDLPTFNWIYTLYHGKYLSSGAVFICKSHYRKTDDHDAQFLADPASMKFYKNGSYGYNWMYLGCRIIQSRNGDIPWNLFCWNNGQSLNRIRKPSQTMSVVDVVRSGTTDRGAFVASYCYMVGSDDNIPEGNVDLRHSGGCNIAWVDGHVSHAANIDQKDPYTSHPFRNGDKAHVGAPENHWDCE